MTIPSWRAANVLAEDLREMMHVGKATVVSDLCQGEPRLLQKALSVLKTEMKKILIGGRVRIADETAGKNARGKDGHSVPFQLWRLAQPGGMRGKREADYMQKGCLSIATPSISALLIPLIENLSHLRRMLSSGGSSRV